MPWKNSWFQAAIFIAFVSCCMLLYDFVGASSKKGSGSSLPAGNSQSDSSPSEPAKNSPDQAQSSSLVGDWRLSQCALSAPQTSAIGDLITAALAGNDVQGQLQVKSLNQYSLTFKATDAGTVAPGGQVSAQGVPSNSLTFTSNSTHKPLVVTYQKLDNHGGQFALMGVPVGEQVLLFGVNLGAGEVILHGNPEGGNGATGAIDSALMGTWAGTPFNLNPPNNLWSGSIAIPGDGTYLITVTHTENGLLDAESGNLTAKPSGSSTGAEFMPGAMGGLLGSGHYSLANSDTLNIATENGTFTFKRDQ